MAYRVPSVNYPEHCRRMWDDAMGSIAAALSRGDLIFREQLKRFEENVAFSQ
ncbi:MAG: hypothetical protein HYX91_00250 [Chloroflexi bacterium]|nr:hypothetical protein [Chloroflexota bacterium]